MAKKSGLKKLLATTFFGASMVATVAIVSNDDVDQIAANEHSDEKVVTFEKAAPAAKLSDHQKRWAKILKENGTYYDYTSPTKKACDPSNTTAIQVETTYDLYGITIGEYSSPISVLSSHGASAAKITDETADHLAGKDVGVCFVESTDNLWSWFLDANSLDTQAMFFNAKVITLSMGVPVTGDQRFVFSPGKFSSAAEILEADYFWDQSKTIYVWAAGNSGGDIRHGPQRPEAHMTLRADTMVKVGAAFWDKVTGTKYVEAYSSQNTPSFVTTNPYFGRPDQDIFSYPYYKDGAGVRARLDEYYEKIMPGTDKTAKEVFFENLNNLPPAEKMWFGDPLQKCHVNFDKVDFPGKEALLKDREWQRAHPEEVLEAYKNGLVDSAKYARWYMGASEDGMLDRLNGTSFTAPYAGGMFAAMAEKYPELSEHDLYMASLISSDSNIDLRAPDGSIRDITFKNNGRGLMHDDFYAGFGYLDERSFVETVSQMAALQKRYPSLASQEQEADSGFVAYKVEEDPVLVEKFKEIWRSDVGEPTKPRHENMVIDPLAGLKESSQDQRSNNSLTSIMEDAGKDVDDKKPKVREYTINMTDDIVAERTNLQIRFKDGVYGTPDKVVLINPQGGETIVPVSKIRNKDMQYSLGSVDGHAGNYTKGTWTIRVVGKIQIERARLTIHGTQKGGLIDHMIDKKLSEKKAALEKVASQKNKNPAPKL